MGTQFLRFAIPIIDTLQALGGSGTPREVTEAVIAAVGVPEEEQRLTLKNGTSRIANQVAWARFYLSKAGYLTSSERGVWSLTEKGLSAKLTKKDAEELAKQVQRTLATARKATPRHHKEGNPDEEAPGETGLVDYKEQLLETLLSLPASGFEMLCQRLLREAGFEEVFVTGRSGDGGIDGHGVLKVNPFVTFKVLFQCKRYQGSVSPSQIRDFRGAMMGRTDKGIMITTGTFTNEAVKEARRNGVPPIELVDGGKLIEMFEALELGLRPKKTYEIDQQFFREYENVGGKS